jgi:hypothetical protein
MAGTQWWFGNVPVRDGVGTRVTNLTVHTQAEASALGSFLNDLGQVLAGTISPERFEADWRGRTVAGVALESRADFAVEAVLRAGPPLGGERYRRSVRRDWS